MDPFVHSAMKPIPLSYDDSSWSEPKPAFCNKRKLFPDGSSHMAGAASVETTLGSTHDISHLQNYVSYSGPTYRQSTSTHSSSTHSPPALQGPVMRSGRSQIRSTLDILPRPEDSPFLAISPRKTAETKPKKRTRKSKSRKRRNKRDVKVLLEKPKRNLNAYNLFFRDQRQQLLQHHGKVGFEDMAKTIAAHWRDIDSETKKYYDALGAEDSAKYRQAMKEYHAKLKVLQQRQKPHDILFSGVGTSSASEQQNPISPFPRTTAEKLATKQYKSFIQKTTQAHPPSPPSETPFSMGKAVPVNYATWLGSHKGIFSSPLRGDSVLHLPRAAPSRRLSCSNPQDMARLADKLGQDGVELVLRTFL